MLKSLLHKVTGLLVFIFVEKGAPTHVNIAKFLRTASFFDRAPLVAASVSLLFSILTNQS